MTTAAYLDNRRSSSRRPPTRSASHLAEIDAEPRSGILPESALPGSRGCGCSRASVRASRAPTARCCPPESIRFFYLDRDWTDALVQGALQVGTVTTLDREHLQALHARIRDELDGTSGRCGCSAATRPGPAAAETVTGFLLRSRAVSGWPALHVRGLPRGGGPGRPIRSRRDDPRAPAAAAARAARARGPAVPVRRRPEGRAHRGAAAGDPVRRGGRGDAVGRHGAAHPRRDPPDRRARRAPPRGPALAARCCRRPRRCTGKTSRSRSRSPARARRSPGSAAGRAWCSSTRSITWCRRRSRRWSRSATCRPRSSCAQDRRHAPSASRPRRHPVPRWRARVIHLGRWRGAWSPSARSSGPTSMRRSSPCRCCSSRSAAPSSATAPS